MAKGLKTATNANETQALKKTKMAKGLKMPQMQMKLQALKKTNMANELKIDLNANETQTARKKKAWNYSPKECVKTKIENKFADRSASPSKIDIDGSMTADEILNQQKNIKLDGTMAHWSWIHKAGFGSYLIRHMKKIHKTIGKNQLGGLKIAHEGHSVMKPIESTRC